VPKAQKLKDKTELTLDEPFMFQIFSNPKIDFKTIRKANFKVNISRLKHNVTLVHASEIFLAHSANNTYPVRIHKYFYFYKSLHYWKFSYKIENLTNSILKFPYVIFEANRKIGPKNTSTSSRAEQGYYSFLHSDGDLQTLSKKGGSMGCGHNSEMDAETGPVDFVGKASRFMVVAVQPLYPTIKAHYFPNGKDNKVADELQVELQPIMLQEKKSQSIDFLVYTGPKVKDYVKLSTKTLSSHPEFKGLHEDFYKAFDFGMTAPIRDLIVFFLEMLYKLVPNYGIGIILFAILFKLVFFPLNQKQADSMKKMQKLQPQMKEINEKFKKNPQEKQKRTMALYKQHKVNPLSGCLPLVIQIPIFIALYSAFSDSYELWKSPFIMGWISDLSEPDTVLVLKNLPFIKTFNVNILPLFMTASQFLQTKLTTVSGGDSSQQKIMQFMPLMMLFFFWSMPAGVVLYWTVQNTLSIVQQIWTNKKDAAKA